jgi:hypothetical protein
MVENRKIKVVVDDKVVSSTVNKRTNGVRLGSLTYGNRR